MIGASLLRHSPTEIVTSALSVSYTLQDGVCQSPRNGRGASRAVCTDILYFWVRVLATYCPWPRRGESGQEGYALRTPAEAEPREAKILACPSKRTIIRPRPIVSY